MNLLILVSSLSYGGAEKQAVIDANMLFREHNVILACFKSGPLDNLLDENVKQIRIKKDNYLLTAFRLRKVLRTNQIEIIHASLFASMIISSLASIISGVKVIWHFHSHEYDLPFFSGQLYKWMGRLPGVKKILFVNFELKTYINSRFKFPVWKTGVLYNTPSVKHSSNIKTSNKKCIIGFIGRLVELKRVDILIELTEFLILKEHKEFNVIIIGDGGERQHLEALSLRKKLNDYIKFEGFHIGIEMYYDKMDIFVLPSREECFSIALVDAGICGIPSVAFDIGGNNEIILNSQTGYIVETKEEFFEKVLLLIKNKTLREEMGKKAAEYCLKHFSEEVHLQQFQSLFKEVLE